jgi:hypothetical protein
MRKRPIKTTRLNLEPLEARRPLSASPSTAPLAHRAGAHQTASDTAETAQPISSTAVKPNFGFLVYRITNPNRFNNKLIPPFSGHVLVQDAQPKPGQVYNVLSLAVRNGTAQTFDASSGLLVGFPGEPHYFPILTGNEQWKPGQEFIFYVLTKKYYPLANQVSGGFIFILGGAKSIAVPGPSGIFLRLTYNPATINRVLDGIVAFGQGAQGGAGIKYGLPDTAIYEFVSAKTNRSDFGAYF